METWFSNNHTKIFILDKFKMECQPLNKYCEDLIVNYLPCLNNKEFNTHNLPFEQFNLFHFLGIDIIFIQKNNYAGMNCKFKNH